jgi:ribosomal protein L29
MKKKDLALAREKSLEDLKKEVGVLRKKIGIAMVDVRTSKEKNVNLVRNLRRDLSQILTIIHEREMSQK